MIADQDAIAVNDGRPRTSFGQIGSSMQAGTPRSRRVLVVDDTRAAAVLLGKLLEALGQEVEICHNAASALTAVERRRPDLVFSDISMPQMDGYELARRLGERKDREDMVLVALTGYGQPGDRERTCEAGFDHHVVKPVSLATLQELLRD
jgi:two-component system CheB/CheR fusion protein